VNTRKGSEVMSYHHGVSVKFVPKGKMNALDLPMLFLTGVAVFFMTLPARDFRFLFLTCLGLAQQAAATAVHAISARPYYTPAARRNNDS